jgi:hypothetical protein
VGQYRVVGDTLSSFGYGGEQAGDELLRYWSITRTCSNTGCRLILTRDLAAGSGVAPISATLHPTRFGWTARFVETQACAGSDSLGAATETSHWKLWLTSDGMEAFERGYQPATPGGCAAAANIIRWTATRIHSTGVQVT